MSKCHKTVLSIYIIQNQFFLSLKKNIFNLNYLCLKGYVMKWYVPARVSSVWSWGCGYRRNRNGIPKAQYSVKQSDGNSVKTDIFHKPTTYELHV